MTLPRVLLVEDDAMSRRFVNTALEELPIELLECDSVAAALQLLDAAPVELILTDLMLPGASGIDLLRQLQHAPKLLGQAKVVVLSAGLTAEARQQLLPLGAWRLLDKPVSLRVLLQCVEDALQQNTPPSAASAKPNAMPSNAIDEYFAGDTELFQLYRSACMAQLPLDMTNGDQACNCGDRQALRRLAHSLKTVLLTLGAPLLSAQARELEQTCHAAAPDTAERDWSRLRGALADFIKAQGFAQS